MKSFPAFIFPFLFLSFYSCQTNKLNKGQLPVQDKFEFTNIGSQIFEIRVDNYDTVSYYDSPYQRFMLDNSNKPDGKFVVKDEHGRVRRTLFYKNHKREGRDTWYYEDGQPMQEKEFVNDRYISYKTFYPKRLMIDTELSDTTGFLRHYDEEGNLIFEKNYLTGAYKEWYPDGSIRITGLECPGECFKLTGPWSYYQKKGILDRIVFYTETLDVNNWDSIYHYQGNNIVSIEKK